MSIINKIASKNVFIIGAPGSGKTFLSKHISENHRLIHTDDYIKYGYKDSIYKIIDDIKDIHSPFIVEGVGCYRLLRKCAQMGLKTPDLIINVTAQLAIIQRRYMDERPDKDFSKVISMMKANDTVFREYRLLDSSVEIIGYENNR